MEKCTFCSTFQDGTPPHIMKITVIWDPMTNQQINKVYHYHNIYLKGWKHIPHLPYWHRGPSGWCRPALKDRWEWNKNEVKGRDPHGTGYQLCGGQRPDCGQLTVNRPGIPGWAWWWNPHKPSGLEWPKNPIGTKDNICVTVITNEQI